MKIVGVIPARYKSSRFEGKPLADLNGKPMIWWVYQQAVKVKEFEEVYVATDDERIYRECEKYEMKVIMTSEKHKTPTDRIQEVSEKVTADLYVCINGDEPLITPEVISSIIPKEEVSQNTEYAVHLITAMKDPVEVVDFTNLKVVADEDGKALYISRSPIPFPKGSMDYQYKKHVGILAYNKKALDFYVTTKRGPLETIEDTDPLRFIEHGIWLHCIDIECDTLSVDTPKDLERVRDILNKR